MPGGNPFAYAPNDAAGRALRERALQLRSEALRADLGDVSAYDAPPLSGGKRFLNAIGQRELGYQPFEQQVGQLPRVTMEDLRASNPQAEQFMSALTPAERFLVLSEQPEALVELMSDGGSMFEQVFGEGLTDPAMRATVDLERHEASGGVRLPRGQRSLEILRTQNALKSITDDTLRAETQTNLLGQTGVFTPERVNARLGQLYGMQEAEAEAAGLAPDEIRARMQASRASAASGFASARRTNIEADQAERGELLQFIDPVSGEAFTAYQNSDQAQEYIAQHFVPAKMPTRSIEGTAAEVLGEPTGKERAKAGESLRANVGLRSAISNVMRKVTKNRLAVGPLADQLRGNRVVALFDLANPQFGDAITAAVTGMSQTELSQLDTEIQSLTRRFLPITTGETSRFSDSEQVINERITGSKDAGPSAYIGKLLAMRDFQTLQEDKFAVIGAVPGAEYGDLDEPPAPGQKVSPAGIALIRRLAKEGYTREQAAEMYQLIVDQRRQLKAFGSEALGGRIDDLFGEGAP